MNELSQQIRYIPTRPIPKFTSMTCKYCNSNIPVRWYKGDPPQGLARCECNTQYFIEVQSSMKKVNK